MFATKYFIAFLAITFSLIFSGCNSNTGTIKEKKKIINSKPRLVFEKEMYNFGEIEEGDIVGKFIHFKNEGNCALAIKSVDGSCDCLEFRYSDNPVMPDSKGKIEVIFNSEGFHGRQVKFLKVISNDSLSGTKELMIWADVK